MKNGMSWEFAYFTSYESIVSVILSLTSLCDVTVKIPQEVTLFESQIVKRYNMSL